MCVLIPAPDLSATRIAFLRVFISVVFEAEVACGGWSSHSIFVQEHTSSPPSFGAFIMSDFMRNLLAKEEAALATIIASKHKEMLQGKGTDANEPASVAAIPAQPQPYDSEHERDTQADIDSMCGVHDCANSKPCCIHAGSDADEHEDPQEPEPEPEPKDDDKSGKDEKKEKEPAQDSDAQLAHNLAQEELKKSQTSKPAQKEKSGKDPKSDSEPESESESESDIDSDSESKKKGKKKPKLTTDENFWVRSYTGKSDRDPKSKIMYYAFKVSINGEQKIRWIPESELDKVCFLFSVCF